MAKILKKPTTSLFPVPTVLVTVQSEDGTPNIITIAWTGIIASNPPTVYISVQPVRYSHPILKESREFVINIPSEDLLEKADYCGKVSGKNVNKFKETGLNPVSASIVKAPLIKEAPVNLECKVKEVLNLGSHDAFIAEIVAVHYNEEVLDEGGNPDLDKIKPYSYSLREYRSIGDKLK